MGATGNIRVRSRAQSRETATGRVDNVVRSQRGGIFTADTGVLNPRLNRGAVPREVTDGQGNGVVINRNLVKPAEYSEAVSVWEGRSSTTRTNSNSTYRKAYEAALNRGFSERRAQTIAQMTRNQREAKEFAQFLNRRFGNGAARVKTRKG